jgi:phosphatidylglycerol:prolipoprotein diacylglycerol transferase
MNIDPVAFTLGPFSLANFTIGPLEIRWYGILIASAMFIGAVLAMREAEKQGWNPDLLLNILIVSLPAAIIGARLYYVAFRWDYFSQNLAEIPATWHGGLAIHGGLIAALLAAYLMVRRYELNFWQGVDIAAPSIILGQAIGRWGNFFNQEAYGYQVDPDTVPWAMYIDGAYRHPTFLYESLWNIAVFLFLLWFRRRRVLKHGDVFLVYAILYSLGRFIVEGFRTDSLMLTPSIRAAQAVSAVVIVAGAAILYYRHQRKTPAGE